MDEVITVGALEVFVSDGDTGGYAVRQWERSNVGECVDVWAPGALIQSGFAPGVDSTAVYSGTPQAVAIAGGVVATMHADPALAPWGVRDRLIANASNVEGVGLVVQVA